MQRNRTQFLDETFELVEDPDIFNQDTGELDPGYYLKTVAIPTECVGVIVKKSLADPRLQSIADGLTESLLEEKFTLSEVHTILALAGAVSLSRHIVQNEPEKAKNLVTALTAVGMFHHLAADVIEESGVSQPVDYPQTDVEDFVAGLEAAGFTQIAPGVWAGRSEQD